MDVIAGCTGVEDEVGEGGGDDELGARARLAAPKTFHMVRAYADLTKAVVNARATVTDETTMHSAEM